VKARVRAEDGASRGPGLVRSRELLGNLVRKELKVKYKNSALGFVWSLANPLLYLVVFSIVLVKFLRVAMPEYHFYLLSGLLAWNLFQSSLMASARSVVDNASLVTKIYFPREVLPFSSIGAGMVHFVLQFGVLVAAMLLFSHQRYWDGGMLLFPLALLAELVLLAGFGLILASANVYYRDVQHLLELGLLAWFWLTPIVYPSSLAQGTSFWGVYLLNPMTAVVLGFQRALYSRVQVVQDGQLTTVLVDAPVSWYATRLAYVLAGGLIILAFAWWMFRRLDARLAEEL
jgi:ABC-2 type transport system permease protein